MNRFIYLLAMLLALVPLHARAEEHVSDLRCEGLVNPLGIDNTAPHFSWKLLSDHPARQTAYEILVASRKD